MLASLPKLLLLFYYFIILLNLRKLQENHKDSSSI